MNIAVPPPPGILADAGTLRAHFPHRPFTIAHGFVGHPLLSLPRIVELARDLPRDLIEYNGGNAAIDQDPDATPAVDLPPVEVIRQIEHCGAWLVLKRIENSPPYRAFLEDALLSVARTQGYATLKEAGFEQIEGFLFVTSPHSTTPFHLDSEDNFFVQVHGEKHFHIYDNTDRAMVTEEDIEQAMTKHRNLRYIPAFAAKSVAYPLQPGEGCFVPYQWPHWVRTTGSYSISVAITWKNAAVRRNNDLHFCNAMLRRIGLPQPVPGRVPLWDSTKLAFYRAGKACVQPLRSSETLRRILRRIALGKRANYYYGPA
jgi:hypothetical protein